VQLRRSHHPTGSASLIRRPFGRRHPVLLIVATLLLVGGVLTGRQLRASGTAAAQVSPALPVGSPNAQLSPRSTATPMGPLRLVALGDSVPAGTACGCTNFISLLGARIAAARHGDVVVINDARPGQDSAGMRDVLSTASATGQDVATTDVLVVTIGANDFSFSDYSDADCAADHTACFSSALATLRSNLTTVVQRIAALRHGRLRQVAVVGYWNIWPDGSVGAAKGRLFQQVSRELTLAVNRILRQVATSGGLCYVDLVEPFYGPDGTSDVDALLADDGDHPNGAGHRVIAEAILRQVPQLLSQQSRPGG
jgi:lysophospholipase L1-like esterase